jgi:hypothetical protein
MIRVIHKRLRDLQIILLFFFVRDNFLILIVLRVQEQMDTLNKHQIVSWWEVSSRVNGSDRIGPSLFFYFFIRFNYIRIKKF